MLTLVYVVYFWGAGVTYRNCLKNPSGNSDILKLWNKELVLYLQDRILF